MMSQKCIFLSWPRNNVIVPLTRIAYFISHACSTKKKIHWDECIHLAVICLKIIKLIIFAPDSKQCSAMGI